jgi:gliding motility-associated-like protein
VPVDVRYYGHSEGIVEINKNKFICHTMKKIYLILTVIFSIVIMLADPAQATVYTVNSTTGNEVGNGTIGSFSYCLNKALNDNSGAHTINFNMPGAGPYTITIGNFNVWQNRTVTIDGTTQAGYNPLTGPVVFLKGNNNVGFDLNGGLINFKALGFQSFSTAINLNNQNASNSIIEGCWFGLNSDGKSTTGTTFSSYAIQVKQNLSNVTIGSRTDFTEATRNVIAGCTAGGILFGSAGQGNYVGNTYIGTDFTGTVGLGNGTNEPLNQHGINIANSPKVTIDRCVISGNVGLGIYITGENSDGAKIVGNRIGTNAAGTAPIPNKAGGIRIDLSDDHIIGGTTETERNLISGNGGATHAVEGPATTYDRNNQCGIYCINVHNVKVIGNYIGTDITGISTGTSNNMGNVYSGVKFEAKDYMGNGKNCTNNTIGGLTPQERNVIGGNGFGRPDLTDNDGFKSHGILFKDKSCTDNYVQGNYIGVGADGISNVGNRQDGVSFLAARNNTIGGSTPAHRNIISNNAWGVFIQSGFWPTNSPDFSSGNKILGNYIGTDVTGKIALGNGVRTTPVADTEGGGVCIQHNSSANIIGGAGANEGNIISGNKAGIVIQDNYGPAHTYVPAAKNIIVNNLIGLDITGITAMPNAGNGIEIKGGAAGNYIGGTAAGSSNYIAGNVGNGIYIENGDTTRIFNNYIGLNINKDAVSNNGDGIKIQSDAGTTAAAGSVQNIIGGPLAGQANTIANNKGNGISILDSKSIQNSITHNSISCNALRGIELNDAGNADFPAPKISSLSTASKLEGLATAGSYIEIFTLDGCNNDCLSGKLQGKTFIGAVMADAQGNWVLNASSGNTFESYTKYTATASQVSAIPATAAAYNTSEFGGCYIACTPPAKVTLSALGDTICQGQAFPVITATASTPGSQAYTFKWVKDNKDTVQKKSVAADVLTDSYTPSAAGEYTVYVYPLSEKCSTKAENPFKMVVNAKPVVSIAPVNPICSGGSATLSANVTPAGTYKYVWTASSGAVPGNVANPTVSPVNGTANQLTVTYSLIVTETTTGCSSDSKQASLVVNPLPNSNLSQKDTAFCAGGSVTLTARAGYDKYQWFKDNQAFATGQTLTVNASGSYKVEITTDKGCSTVTATPVKITVNPNPVPSVTPSNANPCQNEVITLDTKPDGSAYTYSWTATPSVSVTGEDPKIKLLSTTDFTLKVTDNVTKCVGTANASVIVKAKPDTSITIDGPDKFCFGGKATLKATPGYKQYVWKRGNLVVADGSSNTYEVKEVNQTGDYTVTVYNEAGCSGTSPSANVTVYPNPVLKLTPKGDFVSCLGASELITAEGTGTFQWFYNDNAVANTKDTLTARVTGEYKVVLTDPQTKCFTADSVNMSFDGKDYAKIKASRPDFCTNDSLKLVAAPENGIKFEWFFNDVKIAGATDSVYYATAPGNYKVSVGLKGGCLDTSVSFPVEKLVNPVVSIKADTTEICADKPLNIKAIAVKGTADIKSFTWNNSKTTADITETLAQTTSFTVIVEDQKGCKDTADVTIKVNPNPELEFTASDNEICIGESLKLDVKLTEKGTGSPVYHWSPASGLDRTDTSVAIAMPQENVTYKVVVTDAKNCASDTGSQEIKVNKNPSVKAIADDSLVCKGTEVVINAEVTGGVLPYSYDWSNGNQNPQFTDKPTDTLTYTVKVKDFNGCADSSASVTVNVNQPPVDPGLKVEGKIPFCHEDSARLAVTKTETDYRYDWFKEGDVLPVKENSEFYVVKEAGKYSVKITKIYPDIVCPANANDTIDVIVNNPPLHFTLKHPADTLLCEGETAEISVKEPIQTGVVFDWYKEGQVGKYASNVTKITVSTSGKYTAVGSIGECVRPADDTVRIDVTPNPKEKELFSDDDLSFCEGGSATLKLKNPDDTIVYKWVKSPADTIAADKDSVVVDGSGLYFAVGFDAKTGCKTRFNDEIRVTEYPKPGDFTIYQDTAICHGDVATLEAVGGDAQEYIWIDTKTQGRTNAGNVFVTGDSSIYTAIAVKKYENGTLVCQTPTTDVAEVKINALPEVAASTINNGDYICLGSPSTFVAIVTPEKPEGKYNLVWSKRVPGPVIPADSIVVAVGAGDSVTLDVDWNKYFVDVTDIETRCHASDTVIFDLIGVNATIVTDTLDICLGSTQVLGAVIETTTLPYVYEWTFSNNPLKYTKNEANSLVSWALNVTGVEPGSEWYYLTVIDPVHPNCKDTDSAKVKVHELPVVSLASDKDTVCTGEEIELKASADKGNPFRSTGKAQYGYVWYEVDTTVVPAGYLEIVKGLDTTKLKVVPAKSPATTYQVVVIDSIGCAASDTIFVHPFPKQNLNIPNLITPNGDAKNDVLFITDYGTNHEIFPGAKISIYNRWGQAVFKSQNYDNKWDAANTSDGVYYYHLEAGCGDDDEYKGWIQIISNDDNSPFSE